jgi:glycosyltransferase involved in cell wall biosynthesis
MADTGLYKKFEEINCCVIIPTYNNCGTLAKIIDGVQVYTSHIIVVNDGSTDQTAEILIHYKNIEIVSIPKNKGKGNALRKGFDYALSKGYRYAITIDSDGQHFTEDIPLFINKIIQSPDSLIVGARNMDQSGIPANSSFGHNFSNFWFWFETGISLPDTQSGYRLYPLEKLRKIRFFTPKFEFEIEVIVRAAWRKVNIESIPVKVIYFPKEERVSHFKPVRDFTRVSILNTILVTLALFYFIPARWFRNGFRENLKKIYAEIFINNSDSKTKIMFSVMLGLFFGIAPIWGFQLITCIALSFVFKLNKAIVALTANISIPPMIPLILYASFKTGQLLLPSHKSVEIAYNSAISLNMIKINLLQYIAGSFCFGIVLALAGGIFVYILLWVLQKSKLLLKDK